MRRNAVMLALVLLSVASKLAAAPTSVDWRAPADCPQAPWLRGRIESLLGQKLAEARQQSLHVQAVVEQVNQGEYQVTIVGRDEHGLRERTLQHASCQKASEAAALIIALAIDPELAIPDLEAQETGVPTRAPASPQPAAPTDKHTRGWLGVGAAASMQIAGGVLPNPAVGARLEGRLQPLPWLALQAGGAYWFAQNATVEGTLGASVRPAIELDMWSGGLRICARPTDGPWFVEPCAGTELGWMTGMGRNVLSPQKRTDLWWAVLGGAHAGCRLWRIGRTGQLRLALNVEAGSALTRPRFGLDGSEYLYRPAVWVWMFGVGVELLAKVP